MTLVGLGIPVLLESFTAIPAIFCFYWRDECSLVFLSEKIPCQMGSVLPETQEMFPPVDHLVNLCLQNAQLLSLFTLSQHT